MITLLDYGLGNLSAFQNLFRRSHLEFQFASSPSELRGASKIIFPGVGSFDQTMYLLKSRDFISVLNDLVLGDSIPILGICVGMQVMANSSSEGSQSGLGWIDAHVDHLHVLDQNLRLPHMGWNSIYPSSNNPILSYTPSDEFYFLHSYGYAQLPSHFSPSYANYSSNFVASFAFNNILGVQFHPEKSHRSGSDLIHRFSTYDFNSIG